MASSSRSRSRSRSEHGRSERHVMHVHSDMAGLLIGRGGETKKVLQNTGATIHVAREDGGSEERTVTIKGTADAVAKAVTAVEEIIGRERFEKGSRRSEDDEIKKVMFVSGAFVGMIIGKGGESIKAMTRDTGARIEVSKGAGDRDSDRTVTILGTKDAVKKASRMIEEIVAQSEEQMHFMSQVPRRALEIPLGFEECEHEEWLYNSVTQEYFSKKSGALAWLNESTGIFCPIREGVKHQDVQVVSAGTFVLTAVDQGAGAMPKTVMIPDLHRVAMVFVDEWTCIACRNCCDVAPRTFCIDADAGRARVFAQWGNSEELLDYAVQACPVDCIYWVSRDELQVLEYVTRDRMYETGNSVPCSMAARQGTGGGLEDPFSMATNFQAKLEEEAERRRRGGAPQGTNAATVTEMQERIQDLFGKLSDRLRVAGWG